MINCVLCNNLVYTEKNLFITNTCKIFYCNICNIAFTYPPPILPIYKDLDFHSCTIEKGEAEILLSDVTDLPFDWRKLIEIQASMAVRYVHPGAEILEIGCGEGILLNELKKSGFNVNGIEPSVRAYERAKNRNLNIVRGSFPDVKLKESFDLVIMSQVLEHIQDINLIISEIKKIIPSGYLLLTQTNFKGLMPSVQKADWYGWVPEQHFWHFTLEGLTKLLLKHNFERVEYRYSSLVHPHKLLYKLSTLKSNWHDQFTALYKQKGN